MKKISALLALLVCAISAFSLHARADSGITYGGVPIDLKISEVSEKTVRIELRPVDQSSNADSASWTLADFPATEKFHVHEMASDKKVSVGELRLTIQPRPLAI